MVEMRVACRLRGRESEQWTRMHSDSDACVHVCLEPTQKLKNKKDGWIGDNGSHLRLLCFGTKGQSGAKQRNTHAATWAGRLARIEER